MMGRSVGSFLLGVHVLKWFLFTYHITDRPFVIS